MSFLTMPFSALRYSAVIALVAIGATPTLAVIRNLGVLPGDFVSTGQAINEQGIAVGESGSSFVRVPVRFGTNGSVTIVGPAAPTAGRADGINDAGVIVGKSGSLATGPRMFIDDPAAGTISPPPDGAWAQAINNNGVVVGQGPQLNGPNAAFVRDAAGNYAIFNPLGGPESAAYDVNDAGVVVGYAQTAFGGQAHAFVRAAGGKVEDLGTFGGSFSRAWGLNDGGAVVGESMTTSGYVHAFRREPGQQMTDLSGGGELQSIGYSINDGGASVGLIQYQLGSSRAAFWRPGETAAVDLDEWLNHHQPDLGALWLLKEARDINNGGLIVGTGFFYDGPDGLSDGDRAFILDASTIIPEPHTLSAVFMLALLWDTRADRRGQR